MSNETQSAARARIDALLDTNSFVEIGAGVTARSTDFNVSGKSAPSDGVVTGYGLIDGNLVYVYSQDPSVMNGSVGEMHARKIVSIYNMAMKMGAPVIGMIDSTGLRLEEASDGLNGFGEIFMAQTDASGVIPQITGIFGNCGGGLALIPALTDFTFMEGSKAKLFVNAPNALKGNHESKTDTACAAYQAEHAGLVDQIGTESEIIAGMRSLIGILPANNEDDLSYADSTDDLNRACPDLLDCREDPILMLSRISDNGRFVEVKSDYAKDTVTALIRLNGATAGVVANRNTLYDADGNAAQTYNGAITARGASKAAEFISFCDAFSIPVITFTNIKGFNATKCSEANMAKAVAKMTYAFASATVPKVNVITGQAYGSAYLTMNSKSIGADLVYAWADAKMGMMDAGSAAKILFAGESGSVLAQKAKEYDELQNSIEAAARRGYVDTIIDPQDTRKYLIGALEMLYTKREFKPDKKHGTV